MALVPGVERSQCLRVGSPSGPWVVAGVVGAAELEGREPKLGSR